jgi:heme/copper-type cytochrome/quinol oxidase subunit 3
MTPAATDTAALAPAPRRGFTDHGVFGMALFVFTEVMLFLGFISAYLIVENAAAPGAWPPPDQPRLPVERTAFNTAVLLASGALLFLAHRAFRARGPAAARRPMLAALLCGAFFVAFQGVEWAALIAQGLTLHSSQIGAFFYLIVGAHAAHALAAVVALGACAWALHAGTLKPSVFGTTQVFWYFVVLMWPALYWLVYL